MSGTPSVKTQVLSATFELSFYQVSCIRQLSSRDMNTRHFQLLGTHYLHCHASFILAHNGSSFQVSLRLLDTLQWRNEGGVQTPPPEIPKAVQNRAKINPIVKTVKNR